MHVIKNDSYFFAFNKRSAYNIIERFKNKRLVVIDFEAFQFHMRNKNKFKQITINDIPYTVCLNTMTFNFDLNQFISTNEKVYQFRDEWRSENELLLELEKMAIFIANYVKTNEIDYFLFMADFLEKRALEFFVTKFGAEINLDKYLNIRGFDLYSGFFFNESNFKILSYKHKVQDMIKTFMYKNGDEYENFEIGRDGMKHFEEILKGRNSDVLNFEKVKKHSWIDLQKGTELMNYICQLANWPEELILNIDLLKNE
ncbi:hypothetical protein [Spiroplasma culicicola]|uniref:Uncharacterized protein n=1 Tax=Spiroplasma culicicola AES-1 TaxID=1276246 RepID=W6A707_9MOLU|nr:hypothetical protein [Spiroplasma culicicola]AHI52772.1 hypothetical protein SCULI_v1c04310 [Spiroplasma culicicola AES-1]